MNTIIASCSHKIPAVGSPGSLARKKAEASQCQTCREQGVGIETSLWADSAERPGFVKVFGKRTCGDVATDFEAALKFAKAEYEYLHVDDDAKEALWPDGQTFVSLEMGGNEGYSLYVNVKTFDDVLRTYRLKSPIRVKILSPLDEALKLHALAFKLMGS